MGLPMALRQESQFWCLLLTPDELIRTAKDARWVQITWGEFSLKPEVHRRGPGTLRNMGTSFGQCWATEEWALESEGESGPKEKLGYPGATSLSCGLSSLVFVLQGSLQ